MAQFVTFQELRPEGEPPRNVYIDPAAVAGLMPDGIGVQERSTLNPQQFTVRILAEGTGILLSGGGKLLVAGTPEEAMAKLALARAG